MYVVTSWPTESESGQGLMTLLNAHCILEIVLGLVMQPVIPTSVHKAKILFSENEQRI